MQKALFFMDVLRCTAGEDCSTHKGTYALDFGGLDGGKDLVFAPFDLKIKQISRVANTVFFESLEKVETPTFTDYVCGRFAHCDDSDMMPNCYVGAVIRQGEAFYREGGRGSWKDGKFASHVHAVFARGHLTGAYWYDVGNGNYSMLSTGGKQHIYDVLFVPDDVQIVKTNDYKDSYPWRGTPRKEEPMEHVAQEYLYNSRIYSRRQQPGEKLMLLQNDPKQLLPLSKIYPQDKSIKVNCLINCSYFKLEEGPDQGQIIGRDQGERRDEATNIDGWVDLVLLENGQLHYGDMNSWDWRKEHGVTVGISVAGCIVSNGEAVEQMSAESWDRLDKVDAQTLLMIHWDNAAEFVIVDEIAGSKGITLRQAQEYALSKQVSYCFALDSSGSSEMVIEDASGKRTIVNNPSDGHERGIPNALAFVEAKEEIKMVNKTTCIARCTKGTVGDKYRTRDNVMGALQPDSLWLEKGKEYPLLAVTEKPAQDGYTWAMVRIGNIIVYVQADPDYIQLIDSAPQPQPQEEYEEVTEKLFRKKA